MGLFSKAKDAQKAAADAMAQAGAMGQQSGMAGVDVQQMMGGDMATQAAQAQMYQKLATSGVEAPGTIDAIRPIGGPDFSGATPHEFDVTITPAGGMPYQTTIRQGMLPAQMEGISQGMAFTARYDPDNPAAASLYSW
jgi:hypothetical protein